MPTVVLAYNWRATSVYASGGAAITNERSAGVYADRGDLMTDRPRAKTMENCPRSRRKIPVKPEITRKVLDIKDLFVSLRAFPRVGKRRYY